MSKGSKKRPIFNKAQYDKTSDNVFAKTVYGVFTGDKEFLGEVEASALFLAEKYAGDLAARYGLTPDQVFILEE